MTRRRLAHRSPGVSLIVAMVLLAAVALASAALLRIAAGVDRDALGGRLLAQADQSAQLGLRFCERQLTLTAASRVVEPIASPPSVPAWSARAAWWPAATAAAHTLAASEVAARWRPGCRRSAWSSRRRRRACSW